MSILAEILREMYVDPELLDQLSMEQRDVLFRKIREEQVRRWRVNERELDEKEKRQPPKRTKAKVKFLTAADGSPWVWVMGEHKDDLSYEELVRKREEDELEKEKLSELELRKEAEQLAKNETMQIILLARNFGELKSPMRHKEKSLKTDFTDGEEQASNGTSFARSESEVHLDDAVQQSPQPGCLRRDHTAENEEQIRKKTIERRVSIIGSTDEEQRQYERKRADEVFATWIRVKRLAKRRAQEIANRAEEQWKESEQKAKRYERIRRDSIKTAREMLAKSPDIPETIFEQIPQEKKKEIVRRISVHQRPKRKAPPPPDRPLIRKTSIIQAGTKPKTLANVVRWFLENEAPRGVGKEKDGSISIWFHGKLSRDASQKLLDSKPDGSYLVRLSSKIWGYTVSVKSYTGVKHFLVDAGIPEEYHFLGPKQQNFNSLPELLRFYRVNPVTWAGQEVLLLPVGQEDDLSNSSIFQGLYSDDMDTIQELSSSL